MSEVGQSIPIQILQEQRIILIDSFYGIIWLLFNHIPSSCPVPGCLNQVHSSKRMRLCSLVLLLLVTTSSLAVEDVETVNIGKVRCGKATFQCTMRVSYVSDCSNVKKVVPKCTPKKSCTKGVKVSFVTKRGCTVTGTYKSKGSKQSVSGININSSGGGPTSPPNPPPSSSLLQETVTLGQFKCGKETYQQCQIAVEYKDDCSSVSKAAPNCTPKKSKCKKGVSVSFDTQKGCTVTGIYKNTGKKQSMSNLVIKPVPPPPTSTNECGLPSPSNSSLLDLYNHVMTFNESIVHLVCCKLDRTPVIATCGQGFSCAAACYSKEAVLCPSHDCQRCDDMEGLVQVEAQREDRGGKQRGVCPACSFSAELNRCKKDGCKVVKKNGGDPKCCFHPDCEKKRKRNCSWVKYLIGECGFKFGLHNMYAEISSGIIC